MKPAQVHREPVIWEDEEDVAPEHKEAEQARDPANEPRPDEGESHRGDQEEASS